MPDNERYQTGKIKKYLNNLNLDDYVNYYDYSKYQYDDSDFFHDIPMSELLENRKRCYNHVLINLKKQLEKDRQMKDREKRAKRDSKNEEAQDGEETRNERRILHFQLNLNLHEFIFSVLDQDVNFLKNRIKVEIKNLHDKELNYERKLASISNIKKLKGSQTESVIRQQYYNSKYELIQAFSLSSMNYFDNLSPMQVVNAFTVRNETETDENDKHRNSNLESTKEASYLEYIHKDSRAPISGHGVRTLKYFFAKYEKIFRNSI